MSLSLTWMRMAAVGLATAMLFVSGTNAADLTIGSKAPPIDIAHWIQTREGAFKPVTEFVPGKVYVIEFWATWCGAARKSGTCSPTSWILRGQIPQPRLAGGHRQDLCMKSRTLGRCCCSWQRQALHS